MLPWNTKFAATKSTQWVKIRLEFHNQPVSARDLLERMEQMSLFRQSPKKILMLYGDSRIESRIEDLFDCANLICQIHSQEKNRSLFAGLLDDNKEPTLVLIAGDNANLGDIKIVGEPD